MIKRFTLQLLLSGSMIFSMFSCDEDRPTAQYSGNIQFTFSQEAIEGGRVQQNAFSILASIKNSEGVYVHEKKQLNLFKFGETYISEPISLATGSFQLTEFVVLNESNEVKFATPLQSSKLAYLVDKPLPIDFTISKDESLKVVPEVIEVGNYSAADFGYNTFSFEIVKTFNFLIGILVYDEGTKNFELTSAKLTITSEDDTLFAEDLSAVTSTVRIRDNKEPYLLKVTKEHYLPYQKSFTAAQLKLYLETPLVVTLLTESLTDGLLAFYPFSGNALDSTSHNYDGIVSGAMLTTDRNGIANASYSFDGVDDYIHVPHTEALNLPGDFSISLWAEVSSSQVPHEGINDILRKWNGNHEGYPFAIAYLNPLADDAFEDKLIYVRYDGQGCSHAPTSYSSTIENDEFQHIVLVKQGNTLRQYLNNVLIQEFTDNTTCSTGNTADMTIGCRGNLVRFFKGKIDDIRIYSRALTGSELSNLYNE